MYEQKEVILIPFPYSDLSGAKQRPALIISNKIINKTEDRVCCLITSNPSPESLPIIASDFEEGSLPFKSFIKPHRIFTIHENIIKKKLCSINNNLHNKVLNKINEFLKT